MRISLRAESECIHDILDIWWEQRVGEALGEISFHKTRLEKSSFTDFQKIMIRSSERYTFTKNTHKHWKSKIPPCIILCCIKSKFYFLASCVHCTYKVHHKSSHWGDLPTTMHARTPPHQEENGVGGNWSISLEFLAMFLKARRDFPHPTFKTLRLQFTMHAVWLTKHVNNYKYNQVWCKFIFKQYLCNFISSHESDRNGTFKNFAQLLGVCLWGDGISYQSYLKSRLRITI